MTTRLTIVFLLLSSAVFSQTIEDINKELAQGGDSVQLLYNRAQLYVAKQDYNSALADLDLVHTTDSEVEAKVVLFKSLLLHELGRSKEAIRLCNDYLLIIPDNPEIRSTLGDLLMSTNDTDGALEQFTWIMENQPDRPIGFIMHAFIMAQLKKIKEAKQDLAIVEKLDADTFTNVELGQLSTACNMMFEYRKAKLYAEKSVAQNPHPHAFANLGWALWGLKLFKESIAALNKSIAMQPTAVAYLYRGKSYYELHDFTRAESDLKAALRLDPDLEEPQALLELIDKSK